jgi:hypothetical protein
VLDIFCTDCANIFQLLFYHSVHWIKGKKYLKKNWFYSSLPFPTQLHRTEYDSNFSILWMFLATVACYLNWLSVRSLHTHSEHWQNLQNFSVFLSQTKTTHSTPSSSGFRLNCREIDCFHSSHEPTVCLYNYPLSTLLPKYSLTIPFPTQCRYRQPWRLT